MLFRESTLHGGGGGGGGWDGGLMYLPKTCNMYPYNMPLLFKGHFIANILFYIIFHSYPLLLAYFNIFYVQVIESSNEKNRYYLSLQLGVCGSCKHPRVAWKFLILLSLLSLHYCYHRYLGKQCPLHLLPLYQHNQCHSDCLQDFQ